MSSHSYKNRSKQQNDSVDWNRRHLKLKLTAKSQKLLLLHKQLHLSLMSELFPKQLLTQNPKQKKDGQPTSKRRRVGYRSKKDDVSMRFFVKRCTGLRIVRCNSKTRTQLLWRRKGVRIASDSTKRSIASTRKRNKIRSFNRHPQHDSYNRMLLSNYSFSQLIQCGHTRDRNCLRYRPWRKKNPRYSAHWRRESKNIDQKRYLKAT